MILKTNSISFGKSWSSGSSWSIGANHQTHSASSGWMGYFSWAFTDSHARAKSFHNFGSKQWSLNL